MRHVISKYFVFSPILKLVFSSLNKDLSQNKIFNLDKVQFINFPFVNDALDAKSKNSLFNPRS